MRFTRVLAAVTVAVAVLLPTEVSAHPAPNPAPVAAADKYAAVPLSASAQLPKAPYPFVFVGGTHQQRMDVKTAISATNFDYRRIGTTVRVSWVQMDSWYLGYWDGRGILLSKDMPSRRLTREVFTSEAWHAVDTHVMTSADRTHMMRVAHGGSTDGHLWMDTGWAAALGETLMDTFRAVYSPYAPDPNAGWIHPNTPELEAALRDVLAP